MRSLLISLTICLLALSCARENGETEITDRIWKEGKNQYYLNSKDSTEYIWLAFKYSGGKFEKPFTEAKGTPATHKIPDRYSGEFIEGWHPARKFRLGENKMVLTQVKENETFEFTYRLVEDTIVNGAAQEVLIITGPEEVKKWLSPRVE